MPKNFILGFIWYLITKFPIDFVKERIQWIKEKGRQITVFLHKKTEEYYKDLTNLSFYWKDLLGETTLSKRRLKYLADEGAKFACYLVNNASFTHFIETVIRSKYKDLVSKQWRKREKGRKADWRLRYGAQICLNKIEALQNKGRV